MTHGYKVIQIQLGTSDVVNLPVLIAAHYVFVSRVINAPPQGFGNGVLAKVNAVDSDAFELAEGRSVSSRLLIEKLFISYKGLVSPYGTIIELVCGDDVIIKEETWRMNVLMAARDFPPTGTGGGAPGGRQYSQIAASQMNGGAGPGAFDIAAEGSGWKLHTRSYPILLKGSNTNPYGEGQRTPDVFKYTSTNFLVGDTAIWTPTVGKKFRLMAVVITGNVANVSNNLKDGAAAFYPVNNQANQFALPGNGYLSSAVNNVLFYTNASGGTLSGQILVMGCEE